MNVAFLCNPKEALSLNFKLNVPSWWNNLPNSIRAAKNHQKLAKNKSLPSLFDALTLELTLFSNYILKKKKLLDLHY